MQHPKIGVVLRAVAVVVDSAQSGLPGYECELHYGIVAPAGVPRPIADKLDAALRAALAAPAVAQRLATDGAEVFASTPEAYAAEEAKWLPVVRQAGIRAE